jgi:hypothetical protein
MRGIIDTGTMRRFTPALRPALLLGLLLSMGCASSPPQTAVKPPSTLSLEAAVAAQQYEAVVAAEVAQAHSAGRLSATEYTEVVEAGSVLDDAWRAVARAIADGDEKAVVDVKVAEMQAAKAQLELTWGKYRGRQ